MIRTTRTRRGTTLVELLVAAAMLMLGMWLLVWLYQQGMASFLDAKAQADLTTQERTVATVLTRDLSSTIFLDEDAKPNRGRRVSDQWMDPDTHARRELGTVAAAAGRVLLGEQPPQPPVRRRGQRRPRRERQRRIHLRPRHRPLPPVHHPPARRAELPAGGC